MDSHKQDQISHRKKSTMIVLVVIMVVVIPMGYFTNVIPYSFIAYRCGHPPIEATSFSGNNTYKLPSDKGYGISMFSSYSFCEEDEAKAAGYQRDTLVN